MSIEVVPRGLEERPRSAHQHVGRAGQSRVQTLQILNGAKSQCAAKLLRKKENSIKEAERRAQEHRLLAPFVPSELPSLSWGDQLLEPF